MRREHRNTHHLATISFDGRFWDAYLELEEAQTPDGPARGRIAFSAAEEEASGPVRTTTIFIEDSGQAVVSRARDFKTHQLVALLRSSMPAEPDAGAEEARSDEGTAEEEGGGGDPAGGSPA